MNENVQSAMLEILKRIQSDVSGLRSDMSDVKARLDSIDGRVSKLEEHAKRQQRDGAAMLVMMRGSGGVFNERMDVLEVEMAALKEGR